MDYKEIGRIFYRDGYRHAASCLKDDPDPDSLKQGVKVLYENMDGLLESFLKRSEAEGRPAHCREGCSWCCHQPVFAVTHELLYIQDHIVRQVPSRRADRYLQKAREKASLTEGRSTEEQVKVRKACPFLEEGRCAIYPARPMACRIYLSSSVTACRKEYGDPGGGREFPDLFGFPLQSGRMLNEGFVACLKQHGIQSAEWPIEQGFVAMWGTGQTFGSWIRNASGASG